ncbi:MarR family transcriptional regulator, partial [Nonomuraea sp. MCN248]
MSPADDPHGRDPEAVRRFVERFTAVMVEAGVPRMASRVLACLFATDSASLTAADLVRRLQVSPASVSKAIGYLEGLGMVRRERDARPRRERYVIEDDVWFGAWSASSRKVADWAQAAHEGVTLLGPDTPAGDRMRQMGRFFAELGQDMSGALGPQAADDVLTMAAALLHAGRPLT